MNKLLNRIEQILSKENMQLSIRRKPGSNKVELVSIENYPGGIPEHEIVRRRQNCIINNTYRGGRKTGMQIQTREEFEFTGDPADQPLKRQSAPSDSPNDTSR